MPDAAEVVRRLGGSAAWGDILEHASSHSVRAALAAGSIRRLSRGLYGLHELPAASAAARAARGLVSHRSAADHWLLEQLTAHESVHVTVPRIARPRPAPGVTLHFRDVPAQHDAGGVTSPVRTVLDCAATEPFAEALAIADSALRQELVTAEQLGEAAATWSGHRRQSVSRVVAAADGLAANPFESGLRAIVLDAGLKGFQPQLPAPLRPFVAHVDLGEPDLKIALEADSFAWHGKRKALVRDCVRYAELVRTGWLVLRFSWEHVMFEAEWVGGVVRDVCGLRKSARQTRA